MPTIAPAAESALWCRAQWPIDRLLEISPDDSSDEIIDDILRLNGLEHLLSYRLRARAAALAADN